MIKCAALHSFVLALAASGAAFAAAPADPILAGMLGTAWEGTFEISGAGIASRPIQIRLVNEDHFEADGRQGYHFAVKGGQSDLAEAIRAGEPKDQQQCVQDPDLSSERYTSLRGDGSGSGVYSGTVFLTRRRYDANADACVPQAIPLSIESFTVTPIQPRTLTIVIKPAPIPGKEAPAITYRFVEKAPKPAPDEAKRWLAEWN